MNQLHDYPPHWDDVDITEHPEFEGLLSKNVEALFTSKGVNDDFLVGLSETQPNELGCDLVTALVLFLKETNTDRIQRDRDYALLVSERLQSLRETLQEIAQIHVTEETKQELVEGLRERQPHKLASGY